MDYRFGQFEIRPDERRVLDRGNAVALGARAFDLLVALIERRDRVVDKGELLKLVWPGVVVEESNLTVHVAALRKLLGGDAISTVPGRGYRFTLLPDALGEHTATSMSAEYVKQLPMPDRPSIVVLPFVDLSDEREHEHFVDGITEEITTELARFRSLFVIARNSAFAYKSRGRDVRAIARELGVQYALEGSARCARGRVRVTAQLVDAPDGTHLWAGRYDGVMEDVFEVQEEITRRIVMAIAPEIEGSELGRIGRLRPGNFSAHQLGIRAYAGAIDAFSKGDPEARACAVDLAMQALAIDDRCVPAYNALACGHFQTIVYASTPDRDAALESGIQVANRAIEASRSESRAYTWRGMLRMFAERPERKREGLDDVRRSHELNPNDVAALIARGFGEALCGDPAGGREYLLAALRLSPHDPWRWNIFNCLGMAGFLSKSYSEGLEWAQRALGERPDFMSSHYHAMLNHVGLNQLEKARAEVDAICRIAPGVYERMFVNGLCVYLDHEQHDRAVVFARVAAGLKDASAANSVR